MLNQKDFDALLDGMVRDTGGDLEAVLIFDLTEGLPLYGNRGLRQTKPELYQALFGDSDDGGEAIRGFSDLAKMQAALDQFGERTRREELRYCIFKFAQANMMLYFVNAGIPMAVCFIVAEGVNIGNLRRYGETNIGKIKENLETL